MRAKLSSLGFRLSTFRRTSKEIELLLFQMYRCRIRATEHSQSTLQQTEKVGLS